MIAGNLSNSREIQNLIQQYPNHQFPTEIADHNKTAFIFIGIRVKFKGITPDLQIHQFSVSKQQFYSYREDMKAQMLQGNYNSVVMLHNPELKIADKVEPAEPKKKRVTPPVKKKIKEMAADGMSADVIAEELGLTTKQVENNL